jgi:GTP cyclohydrolase III
MTARGPVQAQVEKLRELQQQTSCQYKHRQSRLEASESVQKNDNMQLRHIRVSEANKRSE